MKKDEQPLEIEAEVVDEEAEAGDGSPSDGASELLELVLEAHERRKARDAEVPEKPSRIEGVMVGRLVGLTSGGEPLVEFPDSPSDAPLAARAMAAVGPGDVGREVALLFEGADPHKPIVMGFMQLPSTKTTPTLAVENDGRRLTLRGEQEIVLACGKASITLTRAGKVILSGTYVLTRSSGVNRIRGGSVQIN
jgi:hypothetical protein